MGTDNLTKAERNKKVRTLEEIQWAEKVRDCLNNIKLNLKRK